MNETSPPPTLPALFGVFFRIGLFTLGGGYAMVPLMEREVVEARGWCDADAFIERLALSQSLPGPMALNLGTMLGYHARGWRGACAAAAGVAAPSMLCMILLALCYTEVRDNPHVERVFQGLRPAVTGLIAAAAVTLGRKAGLGRWGWPVAAVAAFAAWRWPATTLWLVVAAATAGSLWLRPPSAPDGHDRDA